MAEPKNTTEASQLDGLDAVSLEGVHNPQSSSSNNPPTTGNPVTPPTPPVEEPTTPPADTPPTLPVEEEEENNEPINVIKSFTDLVTLVGEKEAIDLTDDENAELSDIVDAFGGSAFNKEGAIVDEDGKILYTADQVKAYLTDNALPVDDEGNLVNANGEVVKTKIELFRETTTVGTIMNSLAKNFSVKFDDKWTPEDTEDSIIDIVNKVVGVAEARSVEKYIRANPELDAFRKHLLLNGTGEGYKSSTVDYDKINIKELSKDAKKIYITEAYKASGRTLTPTYSKYLDSLDEEDYNTEVAANINLLKENQIKHQKEVDARLKEKEQQEAKELERYWNTVTTTVKNGKLANINIPIPERENFLNYLTNPVQDGKSKDMLDAEKDDVDFDLLVSYFRFKGKDFSALAKNIASTQNVQGLRDKMNKNRLRNVSSDKGQKPKTPNNYIPNLGEVKLV